MKRYHNRRVRDAWIYVMIPGEITVDHARNWCRRHLGARYHYDGYRSLWFERNHDAEQFRRMAVWEILRT
jgi:hypothetical protein